MFVRLKIIVSEEVTAILGLLFDSKWIGLVVYAPKIFLFAPSHKKRTVP